MDKLTIFFNQIFFPHSRKDPINFGIEDDVKKQKLNTLTSKTKDVTEDRSLKIDIQSREENLILETQIIKLKRRSAYCFHYWKKQ